MTLDKLVTGMTGRGHEVRVFRPSRGTEDTALWVDGIRHTPMRGAGIPGYPELRFGFPAGQKFFEIWRATRPDLVHVATEGPLGWSAVRAARRLMIPVTSGFHTNFHSYGRHYRLALLKPLAITYLKYFHNRTRATFVPTRAIALELSEAGFRNLEVMGRGVDTALYSPARRSSLLRASWNIRDNPVVLYVGRLAAEKNIPLAIRAFAAIKKVRPAARFVLVGSGPLEAELRRAHPEFVFAGVRHGEDLAIHYASADLFLFPSLTETFGNVVTEAMASGLPVLAFDYAAAKEHIRSWQTGVTVPFGDDDAFVAAAAAMAEHTSYLPALGAAAREATHGVTWENVIDNWEEALLSITAIAPQHSGCVPAHRAPAPHI